MKRCKHESAVIRYLGGHQTGIWKPWTNYVKRCASCDFLLSLGPSNDAPDAVQVEIDAADRAARGDLSFGGHAGYLARCIATHPDGGES